MSLGELLVFMASAINLLCLFVQCWKQVDSLNGSYGGRDPDGSSENTIDKAMIINDSLAPFTIEVQAENTHHNLCILYERERVCVRIM